MSESNMWRVLRPAFSGVNEHAVRVENAIESGTPDANVSFDGYEGWIELKHLDAWPTRSEAIVQVRKFTPQQRLWLDRRFRINGSAHLLMRVGDDWLLFDGDVAAEHLGKVARSRLEEVATMVWSGKIDTDELKSALTMRFPHGRPMKRREVIATARRRRILKLFQDHEKEHGIAPSIKHLAMRTGLNINIVNRTLKQLVNQGELEMREIGEKSPGIKHREFTSAAG